MGRHARQTVRAGWISSALMALVDVVVLQEPWGEAWEDGRQDLDSGTAAQLWLAILGGSGVVLLALGALLEYGEILPTNPLLWTGVVLGLLGLGGFVAHGMGFLLGTFASWFGDCAAVVMAGVILMVFRVL